MFVVKDSMVLIHLALTAVLREACIMFGGVIISPAVHDEVVEKGVEKARSDAYVVRGLEGEKYIHVVSVVDKQLMGELGKYGLEGGELEPVTLYLRRRQI